MPFSYIARADFDDLTAYRQFIDESFSRRKCAGFGRGSTSTSGTRRSCLAGAPADYEDPSSP